MLLRRARASYKSWPGLENPRRAEPIDVVRDKCDRSHSARKWWHRVHVVAYRTSRSLRQFFRAIENELTEAPKRTLVEVFLGLPIVLLPVDPYRTWVLTWKYAWWGLGALAVASFLFGVGRRLYEQREGTRRITRAAEYLQLVIECARPHTKEGAEGVEPTQEHLRHSIAIVLQAMADLVREMLQVPDDVRLHANLMIPMAVVVSREDEPKDGAGIVAYSIKRPAEPAWTRLVMGDLGAGEAFVSGKVCVVEDTGDPKWHGVFRGVRSRCFASFPVLQGSGKVVAVVNVDADRPMVLTRQNASAEVYQALVGPLALLADILYNTRIVGIENDASEPSKRRGR
jgi:hypothetical protein